MCTWVTRLDTSTPIFMVLPSCMEQDGITAHGIVPSIIHVPVPGDTVYVTIPGLDGASASTIILDGSMPASVMAAITPGTIGQVAGGVPAITAPLIATGPFIMEEHMVTTITATMITGLM